MEPLRILTAAEQMAEYLRRALARGAWGGRVPGGNQLAGHLGVGRNTVEAALQQLENEGFLSGQGAGKRRVLMQPGQSKERPSLRLGILAFDAADRSLPYMIDLNHRLSEEGYTVFYAPKTILDLEQKVDRLKRMVEQTEADAWVVMGGSRELNEWFASRPVPTFALFGRRRGVPIAGAGPDKIQAIRDLVRRLVGLGHWRIAFFVRSERRNPQPGALERAYLEELAAHGITTGAYNLPDWEETAEGFLGRLDDLFSLTPPTALILDETITFAAAQQHLARKGILAPLDVSLISCDPPDAVLAWMRPSVAHIHWDPRPVVRRIVQWAANVSDGRKDLRQTKTVAQFVNGGTMGPAKGKQAGASAAWPKS